MQTTKSPNQTMDPINRKQERMRNLYILLHSTEIAGAETLKMNIKPWEGSALFNE